MQLKSVIAKLLHRKNEEMPAKKKAVKIDKKLIPRRNRRANMAMNGKKRREWEPTARQWAIYEAICRGASTRQVGATFETTFQNVSALCLRMDDYLASYYIDSVRRIRARHTQHLEHIFCEAMTAWGQSKEDGITETEGDGPKGPMTSKKTVHQCGAPAFLFEARSALSDIRKIHAADKNPKVDESNPDDAGDRVAGKDRNQMIQERINALNATLRVSEALGGEQKASAEQAG